MPYINSFQLIGGILKAHDRCRQREIELFPLWLYLVKIYHADSQIIVGTIVQRLMGKVLGDDPVGIVFAGNSMGNIHSIQDMDSQVYGLVARLNRISKVSQRSGANQSGGRCQIAWGTKQTTALTEGCENISAQMQSLVCGFVEFNIITKINHMEIIRRRVGTHADGVFVNCSPLVSELDYDACSSFVVNGVVNF